MRAAPQRSKVSIAKATAELARRACSRRARSRPSNCYQSSSGRVGGIGIVVTLPVAEST